MARRADGAKQADSSQNRPAVARTERVKPQRCWGSSAFLPDLQDYSTSLPGFGKRLVLDGSEKAASAQESKKNEIYCDCCLAKEVAVVTSCLACPEHRQAALGSSELRSCWTCSPSKDSELPTRGCCGQCCAKGILRCACCPSCPESSADVELSQALREEDKAGQYMVMSSGAVKNVQSSTLDGDLVLFAGEDSLQLWASNTYHRAQRDSSPWSSDPREGLAGGFRLLLVAVGTAQQEVVAFLEEKGSMAVNHINRIKIHLEHKRVFIENKLKLEKMPAHSTKCLFSKECCEFRKSSGVDALPSVYIGLKDKLSRIRRDFLVRPRENEKQPDKKGMNSQCEQQRPNSLLISLETRCMNSPSCPWYKSHEQQDINWLSLYPHKRARNNDKVTNTAPWEQLYPDHPKGFEHTDQVMSDKNLYFSHYYFEVEISGADVYPGIDQTGSESNSCTLGNNFWSIVWNGKGFSAWHSDVKIPKMDVFGRVGVYPNYPSRTLSFYGVTYDDVTLMHQFEYDFVESLYPDFWLLKKENVRIIWLGEGTEKTPASLCFFGELLP
ncbi:LOW QUALITY PROTEIN: tripartite motif-containing protein 16 [Spheniscus humboldti]